MHRSKTPCPVISAEETTLKNQVLLQCCFRPIQTRASPSICCVHTACSHLWVDTEPVGQVEHDDDFKKTNQNWSTTSHLANRCHTASSITSTWNALVFFSLIFSYMVLVFITFIHTDTQVFFIQWKVTREEQGLNVPSNNTSTVTHSKHGCHTLPTTHLSVRNLYQTGPWTQSTISKEKCLCTRFEFWKEVNSWWFWSYSD